MLGGMDFDDRARLDTSQVQDRRGRSVGGGRGAGGGAGLLGLLLPMLLRRRGGRFGLLGLLVVGALLIGPQLFGGGSGSPLSSGSSQVSGTGSASDLGERCRTGADADRDEDCRIVGVVNDIQTYWASTLDGYSEADTRLFTGQTQTGCGAATSAVGPFYCPADDMVYIDLGFFDELRTTYGASGGPFAEAYVLAHEYGHHLQDLDGTSEQVQRAGRQTGPSSPSMRLELQADCYAGTWAGAASERGFLTITDADVRDGLSAAAAVGDDRIQERSSGRVDPESFSHGTSEQRQMWFRTGFAGRSCDTFTGDL